MPSSESKKATTQRALGHIDFNHNSPLKNHNPALAVSVTLCFYRRVNWTRKKLPALCICVTLTLGQTIADSSSDTAGLNLRYTQPSLGKYIGN